MTGKASSHRAAIPRQELSRWRCKIRIKVEAFYHQAYFHTAEAFRGLHVGHAASLVSNRTWSLPSNFLLNGSAEMDANRHDVYHKCDETRNLKNKETLSRY